MEKIETDVVVIGGGATGAGALRDLSLRGVKAVLVEQQDLTNGTSSRFHGLLHSGARYVVGDEEAAVESYKENLIIKETIPGAVENTSGLFVKLSIDDDNYVNKWLISCNKLGIPYEMLSLEKAFMEEPFIAKNAEAVYRVPDCSIDGFKLVIDLCADAVARGSKVLTYHQAVGFILEQGRVVGVELINKYTGEKLLIYSKLVINAAGPWATQITKLAGVNIEMINSRGIVVVFNHRFIKQVINRLRMPGDADIFVPAHNVTIFGTTAINVGKPDDYTIDKEELGAMLKEGTYLVPDIDQLRIIRAFAGVRPLYKDVRAISENGRDVTRGITLLDHELIDGIAGLITITGGKLTTFRLMAEKTVDLVCKKLGISTKCTTRNEVIPHREAKEFYQENNLASAAKKKLVHLAGSKVASLSKQLKEDVILKTVICECEQVTLAEIAGVMQDHVFNLGDIRRRTRLGMGPCQGTFCHHRAAVMAVERGLASTEAAETAVINALVERQRGMEAVAEGETAKQLLLMQAIYNVSLALGKGV